MNNGNLAETNHAIVTLRYLEETEKALAPASLVVKPARNKGVVSYQWTLIYIALLVALLVLLVTRKRWQKSKGHNKQVHMADDFSNPSSTYDINDCVESANSSDLKTQSRKPYGRYKSGFNSQDKDLYSYDFEETIISMSDFIVNGFSPVDKLNAIDQVPLHVANAFNEAGDGFSNASFTYDFSDLIESPSSFGMRSNSQVKKQKPYPSSDIEEGILIMSDFMVNMLSPHGDVSIDNIHSQSSILNTETGDYTTDLHNNGLVHDYNGTVKNRSLNLGAEVEFTYEGTGTNREVIPKCSICFKNADGWMKCCNCGNSSCDKIAHATCVNGKYPSPSISYPGTPPPMLPPILCESASSWVRQSRSIKEDNNSIATGTLISQSFDETVRACNQLHLGCLPCR